MACVLCRTKALAPYEAVRCTGAAAPIALGAAWKGLNIIKGCNNNALAAAVCISLAMKFIWNTFRNKTFIPSFKRTWGQTFNTYPHSCQSWFVFFPLRPRLGSKWHGVHRATGAIYRIKPNKSNAGILLYQSNQLSTIRMPFWQRHKSSFDKLCKSLLYYLSKDTISCRILNILSLSDPGACSKPSSGKNISCFNVSTPLASCGMRHLLRLSQNDAK